MRKFKVLKDLPESKAGTILYQKENKDHKYVHDIDADVMYIISYCEKYPEFFKEIKEPETNNNSDCVNCKFVIGFSKFKSENEQLNADILFKQERLFEYQDEIKQLNFKVEALHSENQKIKTEIIKVCNTCSKLSNHIAEISRLEKENKNLKAKLNEYKDLVAKIGRMTYYKE